MSIHNPYSQVSGIHDASMFFGRRFLTQDILDTLLADPATSVLIIGQRKIGKTSLSLHLSRAKTLANNRQQSGENPRFVFLSGQTDSHALESREAFYNSLIAQYLTSLTNHQSDKPGIWPDIDNKAGSSFQKWQHLLQELERRHLRLVTIFDEFDKVMVREALIDDGVFSSLRGFANDFSLYSWITCTYRHPRNVFQDAFNEFKIPKLICDSESDFYGVAIPYPVKLFDDAEVDELIYIPSQDNGVLFQTEEVAAIKQMGGRFPFFVQRACFHFFNVHQREEGVELREIVRRIRWEALPYWDGYWSKLTPTQQKTLINIANEQEVSDDAEELEQLSEMALIYKDREQNWHPFSAEFAKFVRDKSPYRMVAVYSGMWINERFEILKVLEPTAHSQVVKAHDHHLNREVAIKLIRVRKYLEEDVKELIRIFKREAVIHGQLDHPNVGQILDILEQPLGVVMKWVNGDSLQELIQEEDNLLFENVLEIGICIAQALEYVHAKGVVHRDLKPSNVIRDVHGQAVLIDFGVAHAPDAETLTTPRNGERVSPGTPRYYSPEQFQVTRDSGVCVGPLSDIFSMGVILYELLTRDIPFVLGNDPLMYPPRYQLSTPEQLEIPNEIYTILLSMLAEAPEQRPDASEVKRMLERIRHDMAISRKLDR